MKIILATALSCGSLALVIAFVPNLRPSNIDRKAKVTVSAPDVCAADRGPFPAAMEQSPINIFHWITNTGSIASTREGLPKWNCWYTKEDLNLDPNQALAPPPKQIPGGNNADLNSVKFFPLVQKGAEDPDTNAVAAVLFNPVAAAAVLATETANYKKSGGNPPDPLAGITFPAGSVIVKTIWEVFTKKIDDPSNQLRVTKVQPLDEASHTYPTVSLGLDSKTSGLLRYTAADGKGCSKRDLPLADIGTTDLPQTEPLDCFYSKLIESSDVPSLNNFNQLTTNLVGVQNCSKNGCRAVLVGFHVMFKVNTASWSFMTFWLTPSGGQNAMNSGPWQFFTENAVGQNQTTAAEAGTPVYPIVFNPYLEGQQTPNGTASNCLSCHQFANYSTAALTTARLACMIEGTTVYGELPFEAVSTQTQPFASRLKFASQEYQQLKSADFVWSIVSKEVALGGKSSNAVPAAPTPAADSAGCIAVQ